MKLNPDCIRDVMIYLEENLSLNQCTVCGGTFGTVSRIDIVNELASKYDRPDIVYSLIQLHESGYIIADFGIDAVKSSYSLSKVLFITPKGHDFISMIRDEKKWSSKIKPVLKGFGGVSLSMLEAISKGVTDAAITRLVDLHE